jgi:hypothetical protein
VTRGIDDIDFKLIILNGSIFRKNGDTALLFQLVTVHDAASRQLIGAEHTALPKKAIDKSGFAMIDMSNDSNIPYKFAILGHIPVLKS